MPKTKLFSILLFLLLAIPLAQCEQDHYNRNLDISNTDRLIKKEIFS